MRVLVTGSRTFTDYAAISRALGGMYEVSSGETFTVVHGGARGADSLAGEWVRLMRGRGLEDVEAEVHRAEWDRHGKIAGLIRNQKMVDLGADICLAFPRGASRGTRDCIMRAENAGIDVIFG